MALIRKFSSLNKYYLALGLQPGASEESIKQAFNKLAKDYHPDSTELLDKSFAAEQFKMIREARDILLNKEEAPKTAEAYAYDIFKRQREEPREEPKEQERNTEEQERHTEEQEASHRVWEEHKAKMHVTPVQETTLWFDLKVVLFGFSLMVASGFYYFLKAYFHKPPVRTKRVVIPLERGYVDNVTGEYRPHVKRRRPVFIIGRKEGPHKLFSKVTADSYTGNSPLFKCLTCQVIVSLEFLGQHAKQNT